MAINKLFWIVPSIIVAIVVLWVLFWKWHTYNVEQHYSRRGLDIKKTTKESTNKMILIRMFVYRQVTYEFSGYAVLILAVLFLIGCILLFIFANQMVNYSLQGQKETSEQIFLVSLISLRAGIAIVIFFICQILLRLYRFCIKVSVFYTGLFDALFIHEDVKKDIGEAIQLFSARDGIDGDPTSPVDQVVELLKNLKALK
jgi:hypothetical protein